MAKSLPDPRIRILSDICPWYNNNNNNKRTAGWSNGTIWTIDAQNHPASYVSERRPKTLGYNGFWRSTVIPAGFQLSDQTCCINLSVPKIMLHNPHRVKQKLSKEDEFSIFAQDLLVFFKTHLVFIIKFDTHFFFLWHLILDGTSWSTN